MVHALHGLDHRVRDPVGSVLGCLHADQAASDGPDGHHDHRHIDLGGHKVHRVAWAYGGCQGQGGDRRHGHRNSTQTDTHLHKNEHIHKWPTATTTASTEEPRGGKEYDSTSRTRGSTD